MARAYVGLASILDWRKGESVVIHDGRKMTSKDLLVEVRWRLMFFLVSVIFYAFHKGTEYKV
jgi:hypothetical protein